MHQASVLHRKEVIFMKIAIALVSIFCLLIACKKKDIYPAFEEKVPNFVFPQKVTIEDAMNKNKSTIHITYDANKLVTSIRRVVDIANPSLDSTLEQYFTYQNGRIKSVITDWRYQPQGMKADVHTEEFFTYINDRIYTYRLFTNNSQSSAPERTDTLHFIFPKTYESETNTITSNMGDEIFYSSNLIQNNDNTYNDLKSFSFIIATNYSHQSPYISTSHRIGFSNNDPLLLNLYTTNGFRKDNTLYSFQSTLSVTCIKSETAFLQEPLMNVLNFYESKRFTPNHLFATFVHQKALKRFPELYDLSESSGTTDLTLHENIELIRRVSSKIAFSYSWTANQAPAIVTRTKLSSKDYSPTHILKYYFQY